MIAALGMAASLDRQSIQSFFFGSFGFSVAFLLFTCFLWSVKRALNWLKTTFSKPSSFLYMSHASSTVSSEFSSGSFPAFKSSSRRFLALQFLQSIQSLFFFLVVTAGVIASLGRLFVIAIGLQFRISSSTDDIEKLTIMTRIF